MLENIKDMVNQEVLSKNDEIVKDAISEHDKFKNFEMIWSGDENLVSVNSLTDKEKSKYKLVGYSNRFEKFCYRIKNL